MCNTGTKKSLFLNSTGTGQWEGAPLPEAAGAGPHGGGLSALLVGHTLSAEMLSQEVQLICCRLEGQLVQLFL